MPSARALTPIFKKVNIDVPALWPPRIGKKF